MSDNDGDGFIPGLMFGVAALPQLFPGQSPATPKRSRKPKPYRRGTKPRDMSHPQAFQAHALPPLDPDIIQTISENEFLQMPISRLGCVSEQGRRDFEKIGAKYVYQVIAAWEDTFKTHLSDVLKRAYDNEHYGMYHLGGAHFAARDIAPFKIFLSNNKAHNLGLEIGTWKDIAKQLLAFDVSEIAGQPELNENAPNQTLE